MLIGYMRVSKADGSQVLDLQKDALLAAGVNEDRIYSDNQSGSRHDNRPGLINCLKALQPGNTLVMLCARYFRPLKKELRQAY